MADDERHLGDLTKGRGWAAAKAALRLGRVAARGVTGLSAEDAAKALGDQLDDMKGLAMKVGQIMSYLDTPLPDELREQLARLQKGATHRPWPEIAAQLETELGMPVSEAFDSVDPIPVAAASIGQVHRGVADSGRVAIKVRYPGIEKSFEGDTESLRHVARLASFASAVDGVGIIDELAARLAEECDYAREARAQRAFAGALADDETIHIPGIVDDRSTSSVLTTVWSDGVDFETVLRAPDAQRQQAAQVLVRMAFRSLFVHAAIQADPHPGNYLFEDDGRVTFLDFGCVRLFDAPFLAAQRQLARCVLEGDRGAFDQAARNAGIVGREKGFDYDHEWRAQRHTYAPFLEADFHFTRDLLHQGNELYGPTAPNARTRSLPPPAMWLMRLIWGLYAVLTRLEARGDFRGILRDALECEPEPLSLEGARPEP
jgi:predicted unusual protein kinase regulating ubiquinone biosynthesis (AarF/ABC1/UbiB family)